MSTLQKNISLDKNAYQVFLDSKTRFPARPPPSLNVGNTKSHLRIKYQVKMQSCRQHWIPGLVLIPSPLSGSLLGPVLLSGSVLSQAVARKSVWSQGAVQDPAQGQGVVRESQNQGAVKKSPLSQGAARDPTQRHTAVQKEVTHHQGEGQETGVAGSRTGKWPGGQTPGGRHAGGRKAKYRGGRHGGASGRETRGQG